MKLKFWIETLALTIALAAVAFITFDLASVWHLPFYYTEPNPFIRFPEIALGFFSMVVMIIMIRDNIERRFMKNGK